MKFDEESVQQYLKDGYFVIPDFLSAEDCDLLQKECKTIVNDMNPDEHNTVFSTDVHENTREDYFMTSGDKIRFFWETNVKDENGKLLYPKMQALNKIGHALHMLNNVFHDMTFTKHLEQVLKVVGFKQPLLPQSMYIFKNNEIGGQVTKHIDASFLKTTPQKLMGVWIPLEDTTTENGCLWMAPGSHIDAEITFRMVRNPDPKGTKPVLIEGKLNELSDDKYIPVPMKKGSAVLIHGMVQHMSHRNVSDKPRPAYTFHIIEGRDCVWSEQNWQQPTDKMPFTDVYNEMDASNKL